MFFIRNLYFEITQPPLKLFSIVAMISIAQFFQLDALAVILVKLCGIINRKGHESELVTLNTFLMQEHLGLSDLLYLEEEMINFQSKKEE